MQPKEGTTPQGGTPPEGGLPSTEPVYVLLRTLSRFDRSEVLTADTEHPLLAAALPRAVPFSRHVTAPTMNTQLVASHHSASPGDNDHASPAGMRSYASCDANAVAARSNPAYYTVPSAYSQLRYEQSSYAQGVSPHAQAQIAGVPPSFHVTTRPEQVPPPILPVAPLVPSAAQIDQAQKDARSRAESLRRAFEQLDVRQVGRVAVTDIIKALKSMKVQVSRARDAEALNVEAPPSAWPSGSALCRRFERDLLSPLQRRASTCCDTSDGSRRHNFTIRTAVLRCVGETQYH